MSRPIWPHSVKWWEKALRNLGANFMQVGLYRVTDELNYSVARMIRWGEEFDEWFMDHSRRET